jgi:cation transporter-like permease
MPLIILLPTLNDMIGDYGTIVSSTFSTMLHKGEVKKKWWTPEVQEMFMQIIIVAGITAFLSATIALAISKYYGAVIDAVFAFKVFFITIIDVMVLVCLLFITSIYAGLYYFNKKEDPNNFLIPITTSIADFGNMIVLTVLIILFF